MKNSKNDNIIKNSKEIFEIYNDSDLNMKGNKETNVVSIYWFNIKNMDRRKLLSIDFSKITDWEL